MINENLNAVEQQWKADHDKLMSGSKSIKEKNKKKQRIPNIKEGALCVKGGYWMMNETMLEHLPQHQNKTMLYMFLHNHIWTRSSELDKHNIHYRYYTMRQQLATSWAIPTLAKYFDVSDSTVRRWINALRDDNLIITEEDKQYNNVLVFILGEYDKEGFIDYYGDRSNLTGLSPIKSD